MDRSTAVVAHIDPLRDNVQEEPRRTRCSDGEVVMLKMVFDEVPEWPRVTVDEAGKAMATRTRIVAAVAALSTELPDDHHWKAGKALRMILDVLR